MDLSLEALQPFMKKILRFKKIRMIGTAALSLAYVASGVMDAYSEDAIMLWDIAAGLALVKAAGGDLIIEPSDKSKWARNVRIAANRSIWEQD
jgi:myo-inositol-1(or 4)-monophosphatase